MALSFSRPDPSSPSAVAAATFSTGRRGFDQTEVRDLLRMVAAELGRLQERERFLERELRAAQHSTTSANVALDDEVVTRMLGEEAARILHTAREGASQIRMRAEEGAARVLREASDEAQRIREELEIDVARRRADANADAEAELQMAKQQGREMVNEARAYRERVLGELSRRRELARQQIEQLVHGRDRLLQAFERARLAAVDVMAELTPLGAPAEYVNLSPTTGPVPVMVPAARPPQTVAEMLADLEDALPDPPEVDGSDVETTTDAGTQTESVTDDDEGVAEDVDVEPADIDASVSVVVAMPDSGEGAAGPAADDPDREPAPVVALFAGELDAPTSLTAPPSERSAGALFARLRAARLDDVAKRATEAGDTVATGHGVTVATGHDDTAASGHDDTMAEQVTDGTVTSGHDLPAATASDATVALNREDLLPKAFERSPEAPPAGEAFEDTPFGRRDAELTPIIVAIGRKVKRVLADEQNEVLHTLRRSKSAVTFADLLPAEAEHIGRYATAMNPELEKAAVAGAVSVDPDGSAKAHKAAVQSGAAVAPAVDWFDQWLIAPLRERIERAVITADGDNEDLSAHIRGIYREWKTQRIDEYLDDVARMAYGRGQLTVLAPGTPVCWAVDPNGPECADAEDNSLAGAVPAGAPFPTNHLCAPAHEGCRCLLVAPPR